MMPFHQAKRILRPANALYLGSSGPNHYLYSKSVSMFSISARVLYLLFLLLWLPSAAFCQEEEKAEDLGPRAADKDGRKREEPKPFRDRIFTGGNLGLQMGTITVVNVSPIIGYWIEENKWAAGTGVTYQFYSNRAYNFSTYVYGGSFFTRYYFAENAFAHGEYEMLNVEAFDGLHDRIYVPGLLAGAGYSQPIGERMSVSMLIMWNFMQTRYTPYTNPVIRAGFNIGI